MNPDGNSAAHQWAVVPRPDRTAPLDLPEPIYDRYNDPAGYDPGEELTAAVNVSLLLGQPLLVTGDPGSGKTSLAFWLAQQLGHDRPLVHVVKSTTTGKELLYSFDELARFRDAQGQVRRPQQDYLELNALGQAIAFSAGSETLLERSVSARSEASEPGPGGSAGAAMALEGYAATPAQVGPGADLRGAERHQDLYQGAFPTLRRQVVLIDEFDKAPRDTPNDLLTEVERMAFRVPELGVTVRGDKNHRPVVVITSNSEKTLPEPFLRRCVYYHIPSPDAGRRREIINRRNVGFARRGAQFGQAMDLFEDLRQRLSRRPGTAELLAWLDILEALLPADPSSSLFEHQPALLTSLTALAKTREDLDAAKGVVETHS